MLNDCLVEPSLAARNADDTVQLLSPIIPQHLRASLEEKAGCSASLLRRVNSRSEDSPPPTEGQSTTVT